MNKKKFFLLLLILLTLTACTTKEKKIVNIQSKSQIYNYLVNKNFNHNNYILKLKNDNQEITIASYKNQTYYKVESNINTQAIIEKNNKKYTLNYDTSTYTVEKINKNDDFIKGYLPTNINEIENKSYQKAIQLDGLIKYHYEKYIYNDQTIIYYFKGKKLKKITNKNSINETTVSVISLEKNKNNNIFKIPSKFQKITY